MVLLNLPCKEFVANKPLALWLTYDIRALLNQRDAARRYFLRRFSSEQREWYRALRNLVKSRIDAARSQYLLNRFGADKSPVKLWSELRSLGVAKCRSSNAHLHISLKDLNIFFTSSHLLSTLDHHFPPASLLNFFLFPSSFSGSIVSLSNPETFIFPHILPERLLRALRQSSSNSIRPDGLNRRLVFLCLLVIFPVILDLLNSFFNSSTFPSSWKISHVHPFSKTNHPSFPSDYYPVSLFSFLFHVLERIAFDSLANHLLTHSFLDPYQTGFKKRHSTQTALIKLADDVQLAIDKRVVILLVLFDLNKAFNSVSHCILIEKLKNLYISLSALA